MNKGAEIIEKVRTLLEEALAECNRESKQYKAEQKIVIQGEGDGGGNVTVGDIYMNQTMISMKIENKLAQIHQLIENLNENCLISDTLDFRHLKLQAVQRALEITDGNVGRAAALIGITASGIAKSKTRHPQIDFVQPLSKRVTPLIVQESYSETGDKAATAKKLGISRPTVIKRLKTPEKKRGRPRGSKNKYPCRKKVPENQDPISLHHTGSG